jgi:predicted negative regulator of RcsB-dependent stress response
VRSNPVVVPDAQASGLNALTNEARVARMLGDIARLDLAATALAAQAPDGADAPYYRGLVQEARGERAAALASYKLALERVSRTPQPEPAEELVFLIKRLEQPVK